MRRQLTDENPRCAEDEIRAEMVDEDKGGPVKEIDVSSLDDIRSKVDRLETAAPTWMVKPGN